MKVVFFSSDKPREMQLAKAFVGGAAGHGWETEIRMLCGSPDVSGCDAIAMVGVKSKRLFEKTKAAGLVPIILDKGYIRSRIQGSRTWEYWRVSVGAHHPTRTSLMRHKMPSDRLLKLGVRISPWRNKGVEIVIAGSSAKYHEFYGLPEPTKWARDLVAQIRAKTNRPIVYRPKPSWRDAVPITKTEFSDGKESITASLQIAHCMITHGSNACFEAACMGIPSIILGDAVLAPISSVSLDDLEAPRKEKREQIFANLAYHQWTEDEYANGLAFGHIAKWIEELR